MTEHFDVMYAKIILNVLLIGFLIFRFIYARLLKKKRPPENRSEKKVKIISIIVLAAMSGFAVFSYFNFGRLHGDGQSVHYWEMFHYYMNSKYFRELGYLDLYPAAVAADAEQDNQIGDSPYIMDLATYQHRTKAIVMADAPRVKGLFSAERWEQFKSDLAYIKARDSRIAGMVNDHGYNATPFWTAVGSLISNVLPVEWFPFIAFLDVFLLAVMFIFVAWAFGPEAALASLAFFCANFFMTFYFLGGSMLRYDWLVTAVIGICFLKKNRHAPAGVLLAVSALYRIFPVFFSLFLGVKMIVRIVREKRLPPEYLRYFAAFLLTGVVFLLLLFVLGNPFAVTGSYLARIGLHNQTLLTNNVGLRMLLLADPTNFDATSFLTAYQKIDPSKDVFMNWNAWKSDAGRPLQPVLYALVALSIVLVAFVTDRKEDAEAAVFGGVIVFTALSPTMYYFAFLFLFFLVFFARKIDLRNTIYAGLLCLVMIACYVVDFMEDFYLKMFLIMGYILAAYLAAIVWLELPGKRKKTEVKPPAPSPSVPPAVGGDGAD